MVNINQEQDIENPRAPISLMATRRALGKPHKQIEHQILIGLSFDLVWRFVEVIIDELHNVLSVPIQSVVTVDEAKVCYVMTDSGPAKREMLYAVRSLPPSK